MRDEHWNRVIARYAEEGRKLIEGGYLYGVKINADNVDHLLALIWTQDKMLENRRTLWSPAMS